MNKNYILLKDKVVVIDDKFKLSSRVNSTTIKEELVNENMIEYLTNYLNGIRTDLKNRSAFLRSYLPKVGISIFGIPSLCYLIGYFNGDITNLDTFLTILIIAVGEGIVTISGHNIKIENNKLRILREIIIEELKLERSNQYNLYINRELVSFTNDEDIVKTIEADYLVERKDKISKELNKRLVKKR